MRPTRCQLRYSRLVLAARRTRPSGTARARDCVARVLQHGSGVGLLVGPPRVCPNPVRVTSKDATPRAPLLRSGRRVSWYKRAQIHLARIELATFSV